MAYTIRPRYGTTAGYAALNRVYDAGELLCELGVDGLVRMKVADGVTAYNSLPYVVGGEGSGSLPAFGTISVPGQSNVVADAPGATATMIGSSGIALTTNAGTDTLTFAPQYGTTANTICQGNDARLTGGGAPAALSGVAYVDNYGAVGNGVADDSPAVASAIAALSSSGGRVVFGAKTYRLAQTVSVNHTIIFQGQGFQEGPSTSTDSPVKPSRGTWLIHDHAEVCFSLSAFSSGQNSGFRDLAFWQNHPTITAGWAPTVRDFCISCVDLGGRVDVSNVHFHNVYKAILSHNSGRLTLSHVTGQPLHTGVQCDKSYDMPRWDNLHFWPYWTSSIHVLDWTQANGAALRIGRSDGMYIGNIFAFAYAQVFHLYAPTSDGGSSTKVYVSNVYGDGCGRLITVDQNDANLHFDQVTTQGIRWHNFLESRLGDNLIALPGSAGVVVNSQDVKIYFGFLRVDEVASYAVHLLGANNECNIDTAWFIKWNFKGTPGAPAVKLAGSGGNQVWFSNQPKMTRWDSTDYLTEGPGGGCVLPVGMNIVGNSPSSIRASNAVSGGTVGLYAYDDVSPSANTNIIVAPMNSGRFGFNTPVAASATAGASGALPGAPVGWVDVLINGTVRRMPYWGT